MSSNKISFREKERASIMVFLKRQQGKIKRAKYDESRQKFVGRPDAAKFRKIKVNIDSRESALPLFLS